MDDQAALGAGVAFLRHGEIVFMDGYGTTSVEENGVSVTPRTLFGTGSIAKNFCALLVMRLVEQQLLDLDVPILEYLPNMHFSNAEYGQRITLRHLLSHTSGLPCSGKVLGPRDLDSLRRSVYEQIPHYTFLSEPGAVHLYANMVICMAGHVAEAVTGRYYDDLLQTHIFEPLQMNRATFDPIVAMTYPLALPHEQDATGNLKVIHRMTYNASGNPSSFGYVCVADFANLAQMYLNQGMFAGQAFLSPSSVREMQKLQTSRHIDAGLHPLADNYLGYGLGFEIGDYRGVRAAGHGGMNLSYNCFFKLFPEEQAGVVVLTNYCNDPLLWKMVTALYDYALNLPKPDTESVHNPAPPTVPLTESQLQRYCGDYVWVEEAELVTFVVVDGQLTLQKDGEAPMPLISVGEGKFYGELSPTSRRPIAFIDDASGRVAHVMIRGEPHHPIMLEPPQQPDLALWHSFTGIYKDPSNADPEEMFRVRLHDTTIYIAEGDEEAPCQAVSERSFLCRLGLFDFETIEPDDQIVLVWGKSTRFYLV
ncbi:beta-lactamase family protein [Chloroflexi bacterium TSY]|nr:beta-lactamase family protein [Chloroflexi bacterium TSY]